MNHRKFGKKLGRNHHERQALFRGLIRSIFEKGIIQTTETKAKSIVPQVNKLGNFILHQELVPASRRLQKYLNDRKLVSSIISSFKTQLFGVSGNLLKFTRVKYRRGDNALIVKVEFVKPYHLQVIKKEEPKVVKKAPTQKVTKAKKS